ncbi:cyclic nucleotide-binding domain-containing protein [Luteolibacter marinus]|uniref:cyclic nucleotide-binding domain-containing protein n=1 Tax=Luteolibacter marinus TaxID=2776705 RepID=UPI00186908F3|nr:cyclic nucleotide-binding domain-containing protein [Luteolibacter marinus]
MTGLLELLKDHPQIEFEAGDVIIRENHPIDCLYVLAEGEVQITKDHVPVCKISRKGSAFGEVSALLGILPTATVVATKKTRMFAAGDAAALLATNIDVTLEIARMLAGRVKRLTFNYVEEMDDGESIFWRNR